MRSATSWVPGAVVALVVVAVAGPAAAQALSGLVTPVVAIAIAVVVVRLVWFWTSL